VPFFLGIDEGSRNFELIEFQHEGRDLDINAHFVVVERNLATIWSPCVVDRAARVCTTLFVP
jgi:hypothetical protein